MAFALPFLGLALGAVGAGVSYMGAQAQAKAVKKENRARQQAAELEARRERRKAIRQMALSRAQSMSQGEHVSNRSSTNALRFDTSECLLMGRR